MTHPAKETILIVDDQEENVRVLGSVLTLAGYDIIAATSAEQAFKRLQARLPDIILLDVMMPEIDGLTACRRIKENERWREIPIVFLSAADDKNVIVQALEAGGVDYVTKPFNRSELLVRVRTHLALKQARDHLQRLATDKDEILGTLAHDLKNGIAGIQLSAGLLGERLSEMPPRSAPLVENIVVTSDRLLRHMTGFLANQRAEQLSLNLLPVDLEALAAKVIGMNEAAAQSKRISLDFTPSPDGAPVQVLADAEGLLQVLDNLISNAIKFVPPGGSVEVRLEPPARGRVAFLVCDSGPGFKPEDREKLFQRYQRLSARPTGNEPSVGLGLSIVKRLLTLMRGDIELGTGTGRLGGADFVVTLPQAG